MKKYLNIKGPRKVPLLTNKHVAARINFTKKNFNWPYTKWTERAVE